MKNPFKFGTIVEGEFFTDRVQELREIQQLLNSENHLVLISPRRFGKSSLVINAVKQTSRPYIMLNLQNVTSTEDFAARLLKALFKLYPWEKLKHLMKHFRIVPTITTNPVTDGVEVSFQPVVDTNVLLEDAMDMLEKASTPENRLVVILDEFQEVTQIAKGLDKKLRAIMQQQNQLNYIFLGSQESMMEEIFERKKSPFYHFGTLMRLGKIPYTDFFDYITERLSPVFPSTHKSIAESILQFTGQHPYYTQQLSSQVWELGYYEQEVNDVVSLAIDRQVHVHDLDFERLWVRFNRMDKRMMLILSQSQNPLQDHRLPTSTAFSAIKRLMKTGFVIRTDNYEIEDPFFKLWIIKNAA
ncbi:MAG: ATP-binding protein [Prevotella sp.]|nr:ATP-binding protein [Prevotella sp.]